MLNHSRMRGSLAKHEADMIVLINRANSMLALLLLSLVILSMGNAASISDDDGTLPLLDIVHPALATALKEMIDNSPGNTYIKSSLSDANFLKISIIDGNNDFVISHMELTTNTTTGIYQRALYGDIASEPRAKELLT